jgi:chaperonin GroES
MKPNKTLVLVKPFEPETKTSGNIIIPQSAQKRRNIGTIVAVGDGTKKEPMLLKEGMIVYNIYGCGEKVEFNGTDHYLILQRDILATEIA